MTRLSRHGRPRMVLAWTLWPLLYGGGLVGTGLALASAHPLLWFNAVYVSVAVAIGLFERLMPHEEAWLQPDGETVDNLAHTLLTKGLAQLGAAIISSVAMVTAAVAQPAIRIPGSPWPDQWPLAVQVILGLVLAEVGLYAAHRLAHERLALWRFHALHHSVRRLWVLNTGRFHLVDSSLKIALSQTPLYLLGAPLPVFLWISAVTAFTGLLTHCNIDLRTGLLDRVVSTPALHRWHHSKVLEEGNRNYGENLMLWDQLLGTYHNPARRPPVDIGIRGRIASGFLRQLAQPFTAAGVRAILGAAPRQPRTGDAAARSSG
ncbi:MULTISPECIES: sterol desaturase family protein [Inquilinus]|uniref:Sterol desaturase/sphingolipid hydroxylase (Fatty acid hydroxylase superfamily) n=1 Tax=Inquilinus ginsengisoli TaxID=363840 RepID=A0ABU1JXB0_9PROT|nr:sterol desaturase family protein [Inquilinus ginsengisoli]MDR6292649.1 sterol desaturase/sphingolipid hydroxylase (fatty acid hydroxylase superfamily) [Inquilinus ginsengisoli]